MSGLFLQSCLRTKCKRDLSYREIIYSLRREDDEASDRGVALQEAGVIVHNVLSEMSGTYVDHLHMFILKHTKTMRKSHFYIKAYKEYECMYMAVRL